MSVSCCNLTGSFPSALFNQKSLSILQFPCNQLRCVSPNAILLEAFNVMHASFTVQALLYVNDSVKVAE